MMWRSKKKSAENEKNAKAPEKDSGVTKEDEAAEANANADAKTNKKSDVKSSFVESLWNRKSTKEEQKDEDASEKDASGDREQSETTEHPKEAGEGESAEADAGTNNKFEVKSSFVKSLWNRKSNKEVQKDEDASERDALREKPTEDAEGEAASGEKKPRWPSLWRKKGSAEDGEEAIEVEVKADSSLRIHDSTRRNFSKSGSWFDPNRPSVHEEALEMLTGSLLIYIFADLREMARDGTINANEILEDPTPIRQVISAIKDHQEALEKRAIDHEKLSETLTALKDVHEQSTKKQAEGSTGETAMIGNILQGSPDAALSALQAQESLSKTKESVLAQFHDETSTQGVVYGIAVNHLRKRVTVVFRGSVTQQDFLTDSKSAQKKLDNPLASFMEEAPPQIQIHTGFYQYLFAKDKDDKKKRRLDHILDDAKKLLRENPGYRLYCTGHSLGGESSICDEMGLLLVLFSPGRF